MTIFISSTCYDLIDVRAELENELRQCGLDPVLSDRPTSDFNTPGTLDSIETCLSNVRSADALVLILNQRYGAVLEDFGKISATHLEYEEAVKIDKPIFVYVRDRLEADYTNWKKDKSKGIEDLSWAKDLELLNFFEDYKTLRPGRRNWYWTFRNSVELKNRVCMDLAAYSDEASVRNLAKNRMLPHLDLRISSCDVNRPTGNLQGTVMNVGTSSALDAELQIPHSGRGKCTTDLNAIAQNQEAQFSLNFRLSDLDEEDGYEPHKFLVELKYKTLEGYTLADRYSVTYGEYPCEEGEYEWLTTKCYMGKNYFTKFGERRELLIGAYVV